MNQGFDDDQIVQKKQDFYDSLTVESKNIINMKLLRLVCYARLYPDKHNLLLEIGNPVITMSAR